MDERDPAKKARDMPHSETAELAPPSPPAEAMLEADLQAHIGRHLRSVYDQIVNEAVPDRFLKLLEELERKESAPS